ISIETTDNDVAGLVFADTLNLSVTEAGSIATFGVSLTAQPAGTVTLTIQSDSTEVISDSTTVVFTSANWNDTVDVPMRGVDDPDDDGDILSTFTVAVLAGSDGDFLGLNDTISIETTDDDDADFTVTESGSGTSVNETSPGDTDTFDVVLDARPSNPVTLNVSSDDTGEATVTTSLTFPPGNWNIPQTVTVTGVDDDVADGDQSSNITITVDPGSSADYLSVLDQVVTATTVDDDEAGFVITDTIGTTVTEAAGVGDTDSFDVVLTSEPTSNVVLTVVSDDLSEATVTSPLTFTPATWNMPQTVTVTGVDDAFADGNVVSVTTVSVNDGLSDNVYDPVVDQTVNVTTVDDEVAGFTAEHVGLNTVTDENGLEQNIEVVLTEQPESDVVITLTSPRPLEILVGPTPSASTSITFTSSDWNLPQQVEVIGVPDGVDDGDQIFDITIAVDAGQSPAPFGVLTPQTLEATNTDIDP
ncbi:MAG: hypothetical protein ACKVG4_16370, partial [Longimicrobiales bacterium]